MVSPVRPLPSCKDYSQLAPLLREERLTREEYLAIKQQFTTSFSTSLRHLFRASQASFLAALEELDLALLADDALLKWDWSPLTNLIFRSWNSSIELDRLFKEECNLDELIETATHAAFQVSHLDACDRGGLPTLRLHLYLGKWGQKVTLCTEQEKNPYFSSPFYFFYFALSSLKAGIFTPFTEEFFSPFQLSPFSLIHPTCDQLLASEILLPFFSGHITFHDPLGADHLPRALREEVERGGRNPLPGLALTLLFESSLWPSLSFLAERGAFDLLEELVYERDVSLYRSSVLTRALSHLLFLEIARTYQHRPYLHSFLLSFFSFDWSSSPELCKNLADTLFPTSPQLAHLLKAPTNSSAIDATATFIARSSSTPRSQKEKMLHNLFRFWEDLPPEQSQQKVDAILRLT